METFTVEAIQRLLKQASRSHLVLSETGDVLTHRLKPGKRRLGKTQRPILKELVGGPMIPADLARVLGRPHQKIHEALQRLEQEGLVISLGAPGQALHGTPVLRRLYALNPKICLIAKPAPEFTMEDLKAEAEAAQNLLLTRPMFKARLLGIKTYTCL